MRHIGASIPMPFEKVYSIEENSLLGSGAFGSVVLATHNVTKNRVAIKKIARTDEGMKDFRYEVSNLRALHDHPNIVSLIDHFDDGEYLSLVMEVAEHGNLYSFVKSHGPLSEVAVKHIARQLLSGVQACHAKHIVHRDIKLENILVTAIDGDMLSVQIADFGLSTNARHPLQRVCGTPIFMAPEMASGKFYGTIADMWNPGAVIYCLLTKDIPVAGSLHEMDFNGMTEAAQHFILAMLKENPNDRATTSTLLNHTWLMDQSELTEYVQKLQLFLQDKENQEYMVLMCGGDNIDCATISLSSIASSLSDDDIGANQLVELTSQLYLTVHYLEEDFPELRDQVARTVWI
ncbi:serine/threonine kinase [Thraustotheca clavata]|uniref:Serine/threonine kinase n=1 Tax=Thraustotheca clavata TaxID=74557 RepID=A0A1V9Z0C8_9STRA|nr:serine/threonine kinase [Thraustotheca clavata]